MGRGLERRRIFDQTEDKRDFLSRLGEGLERSQSQGIRWMSTYTQKTVFETDLRIEAAHMLDAAKSYFREVAIPNEIRSEFSKAFIALLESEHEYA